ncbi:transcriptional regulator, PadR-like family [Methanococcus vannielii SB]|jgi:DNA-binding PadR family transcriptional regulator|uniref:Transcriptional regulator, PadR-like family n=1 Tax=Methanococcus vannielii (strain ATCC 35089 / DSM 1224 / JCM 13029 / OCM 148 / SB) TaxID=406327 RepID=A6URE9_METVS|nr:PadR family transcriptional regulator [Methanococcus vannielii]ABR55071.1 transcriptional regulator, PadR-like family [Methanococcus vannielii SB]
MSKMKKIKELVKILIMHDLEKEPLHGYSLISKLGDKLGISMSASMIYPILSSLKTKGLIEIEKTDVRGKKVYRLTENGSKFLYENSEKVEYALKKSDALFHFHFNGGLELKNALHTAIKEFVNLDENKKKK